MILSEIIEGRSFISNMIKQYPEKRQSLFDLYVLFIGEIECGESPANELSLLISSANECVEVGV